MKINNHHQEMVLGYNLTCQAPLCMLTWLKNNYCYH